jgi:hypothetical protein
VIPMIENSQANAIERVQAVRAMGNAGFAMGANSLIGLLRDGSEIPKEELVWALEAISGMRFGDDADAWAAWWDTVPEAAKCMTHAAAGPDAVINEPKPSPPALVADNERAPATIYAEESQEESIS